MTIIYFIAAVVAMISMVHYIRRADELSRGVVAIENGFDVKLKSLNDGLNKIGSVIGGFITVVVLLAIVCAIFAHFGFFAFFLF